MVRLTGPGLAQSASGTLADTLIFSHWKGKAYLKQHASPKQPRTGPQIAMRAMMQILSEEWRNLSTGDKATWQQLATDQEISPFNAFQQINLTRWRDHLGPSQPYPAIETGLQASTTNPVVTPITRGLKITSSVTNLQDGWLALYHHVAYYNGPWNWNTLIHALKLPASGAFEWIWRPLNAGTYYLQVALCNTNGLRSTTAWPEQGTVT